MKSKEEKIAYADKKVKENQESYQRCKAYLMAKGMSEENCDEEDYCGFFKDMIVYWKAKLEQLNQ